MRIAIPVVEGRLCMHFGHCQVFSIVEVDEQINQITSITDLVPPPHEPGVLPRWLGEQNVDVIIAGGMGQRAQALFANQNIKVLVGAPSLPPRDVVIQFLAETLQTGDNACSH